MTSSMSVVQDVFFRVLSSHTTECAFWHTADLLAFKEVIADPLLSILASGAGGIAAISSAS